MHTCGLWSSAHTHRSYCVSCSFILFPMPDSESLTEPGVRLVASKPQQSIPLSPPHTALVTGAWPPRPAFMWILRFWTQIHSLCTYWLLLSLRPFLAFSHLKFFLILFFRLNSESTSFCYLLFQPNRLLLYIHFMLPMLSGSMLLSRVEFSLCVFSLPNYL